MSQQGKASTVVAPLRRTFMFFQSVRWGLGLWFAGVLGVLGLLTADAIWALPAGVRSVAPPAALALLAALALAALVSVFRKRDQLVARSTEKSFPHLGTAITNAVQLESDRSEHPVTEHLRREAVRRGRRMAGEARVWPVVRKGVLRAFWIAGAVSLAAAVSYGVLPEVWHSVLPRYLDPHGDHPPYSRLKIRLNLASSEVLYGGQCEIEGVTRGAPVDKLYLVAQTQSGKTQTVMFRRPDRSFFQTLANLTEPTTVWITDGRARSHRHRIDIRMTPQINLVMVHAEFPKYTRLKAKKRKLDSPALRFPKRTRVSMRVASNRPLRSGTLELTPVLGGKSQSISMTVDPANPKSVEGGFELTEAVAFELKVTDTEGFASTHTKKGRITLRPDRRPILQVIEPGRHAVATPRVSIPVKVSAEDDYAVDKLVWFRGFNRSTQRPKALKFQTDGKPEEARYSGAFNLGDLGVRPGDRIEYFFEAADNNPDGPNLATSRMFTLEIISEEQYKQMLRNMAAQKALFEQYFSLTDQLRRLLERAEVLESKVKKAGQPGAPDGAKTAARQEAQELAKALENYRKALNKTLSEPQMFDLEEAFREHLQSQSGQIGRLGEQARRLAKPPGPLDPETARRIAEALRRMQGPMQENVGEPARQLASVARLLAKADAFVRLAEQQKELARLTQRFEDHEGQLSRLQQIQLQELASAQRNLRDKFNRWMKDVPELLEKVPSDPHYDPLRENVNRFLALVEEAGIEKDLEGAVDEFAALDGPEAYRMALQAAEKMDALIARSEADPKQRQGVAGQCLRFQPTLARKMGQSLQQILSAMKSRGSGGSGGSGYGLFGDNVGLYGPNVHLARRGGGSGNRSEKSAGGRGGGPVHGEPSEDQHLPKTDQSIRVRLQHEARFPLKYRDLVGEYFRAVAESQD